MKHLKNLVVTLSLLFFTPAPRADVLVEVHGYLGSAASWDASGVNAALAGQGWMPAGVLVQGPGGVRIIPGPGAAAANKVYTVELPSIAPLGLQAAELDAMLRAVEARHPGEPITLVGHSAGGVVARLAMVQGGHAPQRLITIASPHLGTLRAVEALDETSGSGPFGWLKDWFAGDLYHVVKASWGALLDLTPPAPGNLLFWLNQQPHPQSEYVSIVRTGPVGLGDELVPAFSQDMNGVPALAHRSRVIPTPVAHSLTPADGVLLARLLAH